MRRMKIDVLLWICLGVSLLVLYASVPSAATDNLPTLACLKIDSSVKGTTLPDVTPEGLRHMIFVTLKAKLPRLRITEDCANKLFLRVHIRDLSEKWLDAWTGLILFRVARPVTVNHTGQILTTEVWSPGYMMLSGTNDTLSDSLTLGVSEYLEQLAEEYHLSGN